MALKRRFDFTKKNRHTGKMEKVGYLDFTEGEEQGRCSLYFYGDIVSATWQSMWYEEDKCPQDIADFLNQPKGTPFPLVVALGYASEDCPVTPKRRREFDKVFSLIK